MEGAAAALQGDAPPHEGTAAASTAIAIADATVAAYAPQRRVDIAGAGAARDQRGERSVWEAVNVGGVAVKATVDSSLPYSVAWVRIAGAPPPTRQESVVAVVAVGRVAVAPVRHGRGAPVISLQWRVRH